MNSTKPRSRAVWKKSMLFVLIAALVMKIFLFVPFKVEGSSMQPTLHNQDRLFVNRLATRLFSIKRGDVVIIKKPKDPKYYVKRIVGLAGDTVKIVDGKLYINSQEQEEPYLNQALIQEYKRYLNFEEVTVPKNSLFVLGDNRLDSMDSRNELGYISLTSIVGKAEWIYYPLNRVMFIK